MNWNHKLWITIFVSINNFAISCLELILSLFFYWLRSHVLLCSLASADSLLVDDFLEKAGDHTSDEWADQINWHVHHCNWWRVGVGVSIEKSLEDGLNQADGWVDATSRNTWGNGDGGIQGESDGDTIGWHVASSVVLNDLENESNKESGHDGLNEENFADEFTTIVAAHSWAKLRDVVRSWHWECFVVLWKPDHGSGAESAAKGSSKELEKHHDLTINDAEGDIVMSMLYHHSHRDGRIKVPSTNGAEHLGHDGNGQADANWCVRWRATPVHCKEQECSAEHFRPEHEELVTSTTGNFHLRDFFKIIIN